MEIGAKPGEKQYEELVSDEELRRTYEYGNYFVVIPAFVANRIEHYEYTKDCSKILQPYNSSVQECMSRSMLADFFKENSVLG